MLDEFRPVERAAAEPALTFAEAMRMLAGADVSGDGVAIRRRPDWSRVVAGPWLAETLEGLRGAGRARAASIPGTSCKATLRPYQQVGVRWLHLLSPLGLGACLADDMGLGKTIQVLALLLVLRSASATARRRHEPAGRAGVAAGQLGGGDRAVRAEPEGARRASVGDAGRRAAKRWIEGRSRTSISSSPATDRSCASRAA